MSREYRLAVVIAVVSLQHAGGAAAQIPQEFTNLQVLPEDISRPEIVRLMRNFTSALGVRCTYCHTVSDQLNGPNDDFASDDKAPKQRARVMMDMVTRINEVTLPALPERSSPTVEVACSTCHGGIPRPVPIDQDIERTIDEVGIDESLGRYRDLREDYYGSRAYDFSFRPLNTLAERLLAQERPSDAVGVLELNAEYYPTSLPTLLQLGQAHEQAADPVSALGIYRAILNLDPSLPFYEFYAAQARQRIEEIGR